MVSISRLSLLVVAGLALGGLLQAAEPERRDLFNGKDLEGWEHVGPGRVYVEDGLMKTEGGMGLLWYSREKLGDCTLRLVYKTTTADDNSGVFIRIPRPVQTPWQAVNWGYEVQILGGWPKDYKLSEHQKEKGLAWHTTGALYSISPALKDTQKPPGEWNTMEITLDGDRTVVHLNGEKVNDYLEGDGKIPVRAHDFEPIRGLRPQEGFIGIQNHHEPQTVHYREISVLPLPH
jgi:hypothetical protein